jgi:hypothetical protein
VSVASSIVRVQFHSCLLVVREIDENLALTLFQWNDKKIRIYKKFRNFVQFFTEIDIVCDLRLRVTTVNFGL